MEDSGHVNPLYSSPGPRVDRTDSTSSEEEVEIPLGSSPLGSFIGAVNPRKAVGGEIPVEYEDGDLLPIEMPLSRGPSTDESLINTLNEILRPADENFASLKQSVAAKKSLYTRTFKAASHPVSTARKTGRAALSLFKKIPLARQSVPIAKILRHKWRKKDKSVTRLREYHEELREFARADLELAESFGETALRGLHKLSDWSRTGMSVADYIGCGLSTQATAALSTVTVVGAAVGLLVGTLGTIKSAHRLMKTAGRGRELYQMRQKAHELRRLSDHYEEWSREAEGEKKEVLSRYAELYREEAILLRDFSKSQAREIATEAVRGTLTVAANISLIASGTSLILSATGVGAPVTIPLSVAFSGLSTGLMITSYGVGAGSWTIGKGVDTVRQKRSAKPPKPPSARKRWESRWGGGVAKSRIGISTRAAKLAKLERQLARARGDYLKPTAVQETIFGRYLGKDITDAILQNETKREAAIEKLKREPTEEIKGYKKELYSLANAFLETEDNITRDEIVQALEEKVDQKPDELAGTRNRSLWKKLAGGGAYRDWVAGLARDDFFDQTHYDLKEEAA